MANNPLNDVSRETLDKLENYSSLVVHWTTRINLIAKSTIDEVWDRHILDSAQLFAHAPEFKTWVDIGSGGGFPGIVMAILAHETQPAAKFTLIESDQRKAAFLRTAVRELDLPVTVAAARIENVEPQSADVLSARALSSLAELMPLAHRHLSPDGTALFMKGRRYKEEIAALSGDWAYEMSEHPSMTDHEARILSFKRISRAA